ncbi:hypothetical protein RABR111495_11830 [Rahnella bruchi]
MRAGDTNQQKEGGLAIRKIRQRHIASYRFVMLFLLR